MEDTRMETLQESKEFLNSVINHVNSLIFVVDQNLKIKRVNNAFEMSAYRKEKKIYEEYFGNVIDCSNTVIQKQDCGSTAHCEICVFRQSMLRALQGETLKERATRKIYIDGKKVKKHFQFTAKPIEYMDEEMALLIIDDITEMEEQKQKLKQLNEIKNRFLGTVSHDLKNPIGAIQSLAYVLSEEENLKEEQRGYVDEIYKTSEYMMRLVEDFLDIYKIETGKDKLCQEMQDYAEVIKEALRYNQFAAKEKSVNLRLEIHESSLELLIDRNKIIQVISNLVENALKFSHEEQEVLLRVYKIDGEIVTEVQDQGPGIALEEQERIFEEFFKGEVQPVSMENTSTGLGLAISKKIIEAHGGTIGVRSGSSKGACFFFSLPREQRLQR